MKLTKFALAFVVACSTTTTPRTFAHFPWQVLYETHHLSLSLLVPQQDELPTAPVQLSPLPFEITSFGAARSDDAIFVYGGHTGSAHSYSTDAQSNKMLKLDLAKPGSKWEEVTTGQRLQGLAMVAHQGKLLLIGGFTAKNTAGKEHDLHTQSSVTVYDPQTNMWSELPDLPEPRSSHDAAVIGDIVYVVGGWAMNGGEETVWHKTAWAMDLSSANPQWMALPEPPFVRRALATIAHHGELFVLGGMNQSGSPTKEVVVYNPQTKTWTKTAELLGENPMAGFGASGWSTHGRLIVTTYEGDIQMFDPAPKDWKRLGKTKVARFFHRMLPLDPTHLVSIGGANMEEGKFLELETVAVEGE